MATNMPTALVDPAPRSLEAIFLPRELEELRAQVTLLPQGLEKPSPAQIEQILPEATFVIGQTEMTTERLGKAPNLRAIFNVEGNFLPNIDYEECFRRGIHVLSVAPVFSQAVAEMGIGLCIDLARGVTESHMAFKTGREKYGMGGPEAFCCAGVTWGSWAWADWAGRC
jgi:phosphoglycerate dehydrogenase-like enzyme